MNIDTHIIFQKIKDIAIKAILSAEPQYYNSVVRSTKYHNSCFELYGFDVLLDSNLRPWLIEVNVCPSLNSSSPLDKKIKCSLLSDILHLVGIIPYNKKHYEKQQQIEKLEKLTGITRDGQYATKTPVRNRNIKDLLSMQNLSELSEEDRCMLMDCEDEYNRRGQFTRIFPCVCTIDKYTKYFESMRYNNVLLWKSIKSQYK